MKAIINGKSYNTETATLLGEFWNGCSKSDFRFLSEELYRTRKGAYFIAGEGGAMTSYCRRVDINSFCGDKKITPITEDEARQWMEDHCSAEEYIKAFGDPEEA